MKNDIMKKMMILANGIPNQIGRKRGRSDEDTRTEQQLRCISQASRREDDAKGNSNSRVSFESDHHDAFRQRDNDFRHQQK